MIITGPGLWQQKHPAFTFFHSALATVSHAIVTQDGATAVSLQLKATHTNHAIVAIVAQQTIKQETNATSKQT